MRNRGRAVVSVVVAVTLLAPAVLGAAETVPDTSAGTLQVTGTGTAYGVPDVVELQIGVETRDADAAKAVRKNSEKTAAVEAAVKTLGVPEAEMQRTAVSLRQEPEFAAESGTQVQVYVASESLSLSARERGRLTELLAKVAEAGASTINGVSRASNQAALEAQAMDKAVAHARSRAEKLAAAAGLKLGRATEILASEAASLDPTGAYPSGASLGDAGLGQKAQVTVQVTVSFLFNY